MDPFRIACPHCSSKIIVRHEQLLGQTLPCPKCKEPVVVPAKAPAPFAPTSNVGPVTPKPLSSPAPQAVSRAGAPIINSNAMTKVGDVDWKELMANEELATGLENGGETGLRFRSANEPDFIPIPSTFAPFNPIPNSESDKPIHKQAWQSSNLAKRRQILTLTTVAITGSLFAILCFVMFIRLVGTKGKPVVNVPDIEPAISIVEKPAVDAKNVPDQILVPEPNLIMIDPALSENSKPAVPVESSIETINSATPQQPILTVPPANLANMLGPASPSPAADEPKNEASDTFGSIFGGLGGLGQILGTGNTSDDLSVYNSDVQELNIENAEESLAQVFYPPPKPIPNWNENVAFVLPTFRAKGISLLRCFDLFGRMKDIGITVDWQSCRVAGIDLAKRIDINEKDKSAAEIVEQIVLSNGLEWRLDDNGLPIVSAPRTAMQAKGRVDWSIQEIFPDGAEQEGCTALIRLWGYDNVCRFGEGQLRWTEQATQIEKANMQASLCELARLRHPKADHLWNKSASSPLIFSSSEWNNSFSPLQRQISNTVFAPEKRPIPELLMTAANETNLNLLIDWQNVSSHGLTPKASAAIVLGGRTFRQTARRFLEEYALEIVPIFDDTVWLTTREARRGLIRVVPVRMPKNYKLDDLRQSLRILAPMGSGDRKFRVEAIPGTEDLFFARICNPRVDQLNDPDVMIGLGWPDRP